MQNSYKKRSELLTYSDIKIFKQLILEILLILKITMTVLI